MDKKALIKALRDTVQGELRIGTVAVEIDLPELGFSVEIGEVDMT